MAKTEVDRVTDWRSAKQKAGYQLTSVWFRLEDKRYLEDLAKSRHQSLSECLLDGLRALPATPRTGKAPMLVHEGQLAGMIAREVARLMEQAGTETGEGMTPADNLSLCKNGLHPKNYPGECRACKKTRNQRNEDKKRAKQGGQGLMETLESTAPLDQADHGYESTMPSQDEENGRMEESPTVTRDQGL